MYKNRKIWNITKSKEVKSKRNKIQIYGRNIRSKRNDFKELENFTQKISNMRVLYLKSKKPNKIVEKQILIDSMLRIIL